MERIFSTHFSLFCAAGIVIFASVCYNSGMERIGRFKLLLFSILIAFIVLIAIGAAFFSFSCVEAQNSDVKITIDETSVFCAYGEVFAYVTDGTLYFANDDRLTSLPANTGDALDAVMNDRYILVLCGDETRRELILFEYDLNGAAPVIRKSPLEWSANSPAKQQTVQNVGVSSDGSLCYQLEDEIVQISVQDGKIYETSLFTARFGLFVFRAFTIVSDNGVNVLYAIQNGNLYRVNTTFLRDEPRDEKEPLPQAYLWLNLQSDFLSVSACGDLLYLAGKDNKFYCAQTDAAQVTECSASAPANIVKTVSCVVAGRQTLYAFTPADASVKQYAVDQNDLRYVNTFDDTIYTHPDRYSELKTARVNESVGAYISPKNLQFAFSLSQGDYILILGKQEYMGNYYYVTDGKGNFGYLPQSYAEGDAPILERLEASSQTPIGINAQPLHNHTPIYAYPFDRLSATQAAAPIALLPYNQRLIVLDNVAQFDGQQVWKWYHVSMVDKQSGEIVTGYVRTEDLSSYVEMYDASARKSAKINAKKFVKVYAYVLPDDTSRVLREMIDGEDVTLAEPYDKNSEWTAIVHGENDVAYVRTEAILLGGLTPVQITVIVICSLLAAATIACGVIIGVRRRKRFR